MIKITRIQLLMAVCRHRLLIIFRWPLFQRTLSLVEILEKGREYKINDNDLDYLIYYFDFDAWQITFPGWKNGTPYEKSVDNYIKSAGQS